MRSTLSNQTNTLLQIHEKKVQEKCRIWVMYGNSEDFTVYL